MPNSVRSAGLAGVLVVALAAASPALPATQPDNSAREGHAVVTQLGVCSATRLMAGQRHGQMAGWADRRAGEARP